MVLTPFRVYWCVVSCARCRPDVEKIIIIGSVLLVLLCAQSFLWSPLFVAVYYLVCVRVRRSPSLKDDTVTMEEVIPSLM